jgi:hypothetical protein
MLNVPAPGRTYPPCVGRFAVQFAALTAVFLVAVGLAELLGADSLGIALGFGQIAFALALGFALLRA